ncbi:MAG: alpha/beta fold hydrolase [Actinomycetota bacterium]|nr:alpha/beta fold hydrolase [Actinomycetota bacterium]
MGDIVPYVIAVSDDVIEDLRERLARTRWPDQLPGTTWELGTDRDYLQDLCEHWLTDYDWRRWEAELNRHPQYTTGIDGEQIHFLHVRSPHADALPLIMTHGWPGSIVEFLDVIEPLTDPTAHGGDAADAFHVVCPSIPGFGFSGPTVTPDVTPRRVARMHAELMAQLGYDRYVAQGGDWGAVITAWLGADHADHVAGIHLNMVVAPPTDLDDLTDAERAALERRRRFRAEGTGYQEIQGTKPQSLAYGLTDSPAGLAGWIVEKFREWSDCGGDLTSAIDRDVLLTNLTIYWVTETAGSSARIYHAHRHAPERDQFPARVEVPTGCSIFPGENSQPSRRWAEARYNVTCWSEHTKGGHFAAMEQPAALVDDLRECFRPLR